MNIALNCILCVYVGVVRYTSAMSSVKLFSARDRHFRHDAKQFKYHDTPALLARCAPDKTNGIT